MNPITLISSEYHPLENQSFYLGATDSNQRQPGMSIIINKEEEDLPVTPKELPYKDNDFEKELAALQKENQKREAALRCKYNRQFALKIIDKQNIFIID